MRGLARYCLATVVLVAAASPAWCQGGVGDLLAGGLIKPKVGQWVWYNLTDVRGKERFFVRQAVVAQEKVGHKTGYWLEFEVVPEVGYKTIYKVLLTGPASDPRNIHRIIHRYGPEPPEEIPIEREALEPDESNRIKRESLGMETVNTGDGPLRAEHVSVTKEDRVIHLWINEKIRPTGIVRMKTPGGEMVLRNHGFGGKAAQSVIDKRQSAGDVDVDTSVPQPDAPASSPDATEEDGKGEAPEPQEEH